MYFYMLLLFEYDLVSNRTIVVAVISHIHIKIIRAFGFLLLSFLVIIIIIFGVVAVVIDIISFSFSSFVVRFYSYVLRLILRLFRFCTTYFVSIHQKNPCILCTYKPIHISHSLAHLLSVQGIESQFAIRLTKSDRDENCARFFPLDCLFLNKIYFQNKPEHT